MGGSRDLDPRTIVVTGLCLYEATAIVTGAVPTVTALAWGVRHTWSGKAIIWFTLGLLAHHLLNEQPKAS